jgi:hypothetical protein
MLALAEYRLLRRRNFHPLLADQDLAFDSRDHVSQ